MAAVTGTRNAGGPPAPKIASLGERQFRALLDHGTAEDIADALLTLDEPARRALTPLLPARTTPDSEAALLVAGAGCVSGADRLVAWLRSRRFRRHPSEQTLDALVRVMSAPGRPRVTTVAGALARQLGPRAAWPGEWAVTEALLRSAEIPPPVTDALARRWIREAATAGGPIRTAATVTGTIRATAGSPIREAATADGPIRATPGSPIREAATAGGPIRATATAGGFALAARLAADPWLDRLLPRVFFPPAGVSLDHRWPPALAALASDGRLARGTLLRLAVRRLSDPSRAGSFSAVVALHEMLSPTPGELAKHRADYRSLLTSPHAAVRALAKQALAALESAKRPAKQSPAAPASAPPRRSEPSPAKPAAPAPSRSRSKPATSTPATSTPSRSRSKPAAPAPPSTGPEPAASAPPTSRPRPSRTRSAPSRPKSPPAASAPSRRPKPPATSSAPSRRPKAVAAPPPEPPAPKPPAPDPAPPSSSEPAAYPDTEAVFEESTDPSTPPVTETIAQPDASPAPPAPEAPAPRSVAPTPSRIRVFPAAPARPVADPMPPPIASVTELATEMAARRTDPWEPVALERLLAGLVAFAVSDRPAATDALLPLLDDTASPLDDLILGFRSGTQKIGPGSEAPAPPPRYRRSWETNTDPLRDNGTGDLVLTSRSAEAGPIGRVRRRPAVPAPQAMVLARVRELATQLATGSPRALLATPATVDGHVSPARLLFRLLEAERDGWQPGPYDLTQALLRLPRHVDVGIAEAASRLVSPAGRRYAAWLRAGGLTDPVTTVSTAPAEPGRRLVTFLRIVPPIVAPDSTDPAPAAATTAAPAGAPADVLRQLLTEPPEVRAPERPTHPTPRTHPSPTTLSPVVPSPTALSPTIPSPTTLSPTILNPTTLSPLVPNPTAHPSPTGDSTSGDTTPTDGPEPDMRCWPMVLPSHRDIVAAHCVPHLGRSARAGEVLLALARAEGPFGPAMAVALARGLVSARAAEREAATEALLHLAGHGGLDAALLARELRVLIVAEPDRTTPPGDAHDVAVAVAKPDRRTTSPGDAHGLAVAEPHRRTMPPDDPDRLAEGLAGAGPAAAVAEVLAALGRADAWHLAWAIAYDVVPAMLRLERAPAGASALVAVAAEAAEAIGARADLPEVAAAAGRASDPSLRAEAVRLARATL